MTPKVRFAPSPTGKLHVGNVRTALINWLLAHRDGGHFVLRIDDTDVERSTVAFEEGIRNDLSWLGLQWDSSFKQSDRFTKYDSARDALIAKGLLYPCYETPEELDRARKIARARGKPPVYDRAALNLTDEEKKRYESAGRKPHWRFKLSGERCEWDDAVRGPQSIDTASVSDPVLIRADGSYLYTLPSVVDDIEFGITHVVRGEDHVTNSGAQLEIFRALGGSVPVLAHTPLLIGADGQGLSKRLGSLSIEDLRDNQGIEPMAICSLLGKIGTSDPVELKESLGALAAEFSFEKIGRAPARFDEKELLSLNGSLIGSLPYASIAERIRAIPSLPKGISDTKLETLWETVKGNVQTIAAITPWLDVAFGEIQTHVGAEDCDFVIQSASYFPDGAITLETWDQWTSVLKAETGRKGKSLFLPLRLALSGQRHGPEMNKLVSIMERDRIIARLSSVQTATVAD